MATDVHSTSVSRPLVQLIGKACSDGCWSACPVPSNSITAVAIQLFPSPIMSAAEQPSRTAVAAKEVAAHKEGLKGKLSSFCADMRVLASHPIYVLTVAGTAIYVGAAGRLLQKHNLVSQNVTL